MNTLKVLSLMLLLTVWQPLRAQEARTNSSQSQNKQEEMADPDNKSIKETYWMPSILGKGIYYRGYVGINTTAPQRDLDVVGTVRVSALEINGQYSLPTTKGTVGQYLNGNGEWAPMPISGGGGYWQELTDVKGIFYDGLYVGIGTGDRPPRYRLHVNGSAGVQSLEIIGQYSLPEKAGTTRQFLRGDGIWAVPSGGGDDVCHWKSGVIGNGSIYFNRGKVGIGTTGPNANASLQVVGNMNVGNNPHTGILIGANAFVGGEESQASGQSAFSYGKLNQASGSFSVALGRESKALDHAAIALGYHAEAKVGNTIAIGKFVESTSSSAITIGSGTGTGSNMLRNNFSHSLMMGFYSNVPTLFVSSSAGAGTTGKIGIGNMTDPLDKLHIKADANETATIRLEPTATVDSFRFAQLYLGNHRIRAGNNDNMVFTTPATNRHFVFENGNVGIGVINPKAKLEVAGDIMFTGQLFTPEGPYQASPWKANGADIFYTSGKVGIGTIPPNKLCKLYVLGNAMIEGQLYADEVIVEEATNWPDYVFEPDYQLMGLADLKNYIQTYKHLPDTPKADENGTVKQLKMSEMNALLLKKIEELTLYILEQEERIREIEKR